MANLENLKKRKSFVKGDPRINRKGQPSLPDLKECISRNVNMDELIEQLNKLAKAGNVRAIQELLDRGYGKPHQSMDAKISMNEEIQDKAKEFIDNVNNLQSET